MSAGFCYFLKSLLRPKYTEPIAIADTASLFAVLLTCATEEGA